MFQEQRFLLLAFVLTSVVGAIDAVVEVVELDVVFEVLQWTSLWCYSMHW